MFARLGSDFHEGQPAKISELDQGSAFPVGSYIPPNFSAEKRTKSIRNSQEKLPQAAQTSCSNLFYDLKRSDIFLRRDSYRPTSIMPSLQETTLTDFSMVRAQEKCFCEKYRSVVLHHLSKDQAR